MTLRLDEEQDRVLTALAKSQGISKQEATLRAIEEAAQRQLHESQVAASSSRMRERYADLIDRLGE